MHPLLALGLVATMLLAGCSGGGASPAGAGGSEDGPTAPPVLDVGQGKGAINGIVVTETIAPIAGALVLVQPINVSALTDGNGAFVLEGLEPGSYVVNVTHRDYKGSQATADVRAGDPAKVKLTLVAVRDLRPNVVQDGATLLVFGSFCVADAYCNKMMTGSSEQFPVQDTAYFEVDDRPSTVQVEVRWEAESALGESGLVECAVFGDDPEGSTALVRYTASGTSPLTLRMPGTWVDEDSEAEVGANGLSCELSAANGATVPASTMVQQQADLYVHFFYNFVPEEGWTFIADGAYPVPP